MPESSNKRDRSVAHLRPLESEYIITQSESIDQDAIQRVMSATNQFGMKKLPAKTESVVDLNSVVSERKAKTASRKVRYIHEA